MGLGQLKFGWGLGLREFKGLGFRVEGIYGFWEAGYQWGSSSQTPGSSAARQQHCFCNGTLKQGSFLEGRVRW